MSPLDASLSFGRRVAGLDANLTFVKELTYCLHSTLPTLHPINSTQRIWFFHILISVSVGMCEHIMTHGGQTTTLAVASLPFFKKDLFLFYLCVVSMWVCTCQHRGSESLPLQTIVTCLVWMPGAGPGTSRRAAQLLTTEPSLELLPSLHGFQRLVSGC